MKIDSRKEFVVFFLPRDVMCYQFCDMSFFSLVKRLMQNMLCGVCFVATHSI